MVGHVRHWGLGDPGTYNPSQIYISFYQLPDAWVPALAKSLPVAVRAPLDVATIMPAIKDVTYGVAKDQPVYDIQTIEQVASASMSAQRLSMLQLVAFSGLSLQLASVEIYGVISYSVTQRVQEIGIRLALAAKRWDVLRTVLGQGLQLAVMGLVAGPVDAILLGRLLSGFSHLLFGVGASDPATLVTVSVVLLAVAAVACSVPA
jgi:putative ABC transport system permease protein